MNFVFTEFTIDLCFEQYLDRPFNWFCASAVVVDVKIRSSAHNRWTKISSSDKMTPCFRLGSYVSQRDIFERLSGWHCPPG